MVNLLLHHSKNDKIFTDGKIAESALIWSVFMCNSILIIYQGLQILNAKLKNISNLLICNHNMNSINGM